MERCDSDQMDRHDILRAKGFHAQRALAHPVLHAVVHAGFAENVTADGDTSILEVLGALAVSDSLYTRVSDQ